MCWGHVPWLFFGEWPEECVFGVGSESFVSGSVWAGFACALFEYSDACLGGDGEPVAVILATIQGDSQYELWFFGEAVFDFPPRRGVFYVGAGFVGCVVGDNNGGASIPTQCCDPLHGFLLGLVVTLAVLYVHQVVDNDDGWEGVPHFHVGLQFHGDVCPCDG